MVVANAGCSLIFLLRAVPQNPWIPLAEPEPQLKTLMYAYVYHVCLCSLYVYLSVSVGLKFLVRLCTDMNLKEAQEYANKLKKAEKMQKLREEVHH